MMSVNLSLVHHHITRPLIPELLTLISFSLSTTATSLIVIETWDAAMVFSDAASLLATLITAALEVEMYSNVIFVLVHSKKSLICSEVGPASATAVATNCL